MGVAETCAGASAACTTILKYIVPTLGGMSAVFLCMSPLPTVNRCLEAGTTGAVNTLPYALQVVNTLGWVVYSWYLKDYFVFVPNTIGYIASLYFTLMLLPITPAKTRTTAIRLLVGLTALLVTSVGFVYITDVAHETGDLIMGSLANLFLIIFFGSPLMVFYTVIKNKDASTLDSLLTFATITNCILWTAYGFALQNWFIAAPNGVGLIFGLIQLFLLLKYKKRRDLGSPDRSTPETLVPEPEEGIAGENMELMKSN
ncbi:hypothetical protein HDU79_000702 [Rhizoclosmatium sp. JEL0117]|nr:hypothetical protein HDU79_000702 [Rhizoclosmatium sp. JEL0117]